MRRFILYRDTDVSGYSGTGVVVEGIQFSDGSCAMRWRSDKKSTVVWDNIQDLVAVHGHDGASRLVWLDEDAPSHFFLRALGESRAQAHTIYYSQPALPGLEAV